VYWPGARLGGRYRSPAAIAHAVDLNLTSDPNGIIRYAAHGGIAMFHPEAADPGLHRPLELEFEHDVSFIGARYGWRPNFIRELTRRGIEVKCFGRGWPDNSISNEDMSRIYARSRINLGFGGIGHFAQSRLPQGPGLRSADEWRALCHATQSRVGIGLRHRPGDCHLSG